MRVRVRVRVSVWVRGEGEGDLLGDTSEKVSHLELLK